MENGVCTRSRTFSPGASVLRVHKARGSRLVVQASWLSHHGIPPSPTRKWLKAHGSRLLTGAPHCYASKASLYSRLVDQGSSPARLVVAPPRLLSTRPRLLVAPPMLRGGYRSLYAEQHVAASIEGRLRSHAPIMSGSIEGATRSRNKHSTRSRSKHSTRSRSKHWNDAE